MRRRPRSGKNQGMKPSVDASASDHETAASRGPKFAGILYPECLAPVEFTDYQFVVSNP
jgi:hypothetical protein